MRIPDLYDRPNPTVSFEFFPPKTPEGEEALFRDTVPALINLGPAFFSVTYGAGGSTHAGSLRIVSRLQKDYDAVAMSHLTCVGSTREVLQQYLESASAQGVENILCLRGDPPKGQNVFHATEGGFTYAVDLIRMVKSMGKFGIGAACFPEGHMESWHKHQDWDYTALKVEAGADFLISQLFYDWSDFLDMQDYLRNKRNVKVPIIPGVLPFMGAEQIKRFTSLCGSKLPRPMLNKLESYGGDEESVRQYGVEVCTKLCEKLLAQGVAGIHFYCLNRVASCKEVIANLGLSKS